MSTETKYEFESNSIEDTVQLGKRIGQNLRGGEVLELLSDIGGGKTTFTRGLAAGAGSNDQVASPTFTISRVYQGRGYLHLNHYDFHRLDDPGLMQVALAESIDDTNAVSVIEWADIVDSVLPEDRAVIQIVSTGEDTRNITIAVGEQHKHILEGIDV